MPAYKTDIICYILIIVIVIISLLYTSEQVRQEWIVFLINHPDKKITLLRDLSN